MNEPTLVPKENADRKVTVRFTATEYELLETASSKTTKRKLSQYVRAVLLQKPVTFYTRNKSLDAFSIEMGQLRTELSAIGKNFNQAVKRLHTFSYITELKNWYEETENIKAHIVQKIDQINDRIAQISDAWLHESAQ